MGFTKEQLIAKAREQIAFCRHTKITGEGRTHVNQCSALFEIALTSLEAEAVPEWTNEQCLEFLSIAFRHAEIKGDLELDDIRLGVKMVNGSHAAMLQGVAGNSPAIPDGWAACSERMPDIGTEIFYFCQDDGLRDCGIVSSSNFSGRGDAQLYVHAEGYDLRFGVDITHWMPLPAAPQQGDSF